jgi:LuxR family maltose regulon positive regulatory protein
LNAPNDRLQSPYPILKTKLYIPPLRASLVTRPRLLERLDAGLRAGCKLTLLSAPAGFGKTTLLSEWVAACARREPRVPVAWVSLDGGDNDPLWFWSYWIAALQTLHPQVGHDALAALQSGSSLEPLLTGLLNQIADVSEPVVLVLDDWHAITEPSVSDSVAYFVAHAPPAMHLVLSSRADPPWPLARLRARGEITELRANDLRFTAQEAAQFLQQGMRLDLSAQDVALLEQRTEGWIAGLQMAALSLRDRPDGSAVLVALSGTHRFILDYLVEEVLDRQSPGIREFLLRTSILDRMTSALCDAVADREDSQVILGQLEQANLFLVPLDDERRWYRYHHLFADLLRSRLEQSVGAQGLAPLHRRASAWYEKSGRIAEAMSHMRATGDVKGVARLVEGNALAMMDRGQLKTLAQWLELLPGEVTRARPWLCVARRVGPGLHGPV